MGAGINEQFSDNPQYNIFGVVTGRMKNTTKPNTVKTIGPVTTDRSALLEIRLKVIRINKNRTIKVMASPLQM